MMTLDLGPAQVDGHQLTSTASGVIPVGVVKTLAETGNRSITVSTSRSTGRMTMTRMGNSGIAQHYARLAGTCGKLRNAALAAPGRTGETPR
jgi:hypothetical protein